MMREIELARSVSDTTETEHCIMQKPDLEKIWFNGQCMHEKASAGVYGKSVILGCSECGMEMVFLLRFGHIKTFDVSVINVNKNTDMGQASVEGTRWFIRKVAKFMAVPDGGSDPHSETMERDRTMLDILIKTLNSDVISKAMEEFQGDFMKEWSSIDCEHENVLCQVISGRLGITCQDCAGLLLFEYIERDMFNVSITRMPLEPKYYGIHDIDALLDVIYEYVDTLELPSPMADKMSEDPDGDARGVWNIVSLLEKHGVLKRINVNNRYGNLIETVSAVSCDRFEFESRLEHVVDVIRSMRIKMTENGRTIDESLALENIRLMWPYGYESSDFDVDMYDPTGLSEFCVKCEFSTLDDDDVGQDHWMRGCPECGYAGYLSNLNDDKIHNG